MTEEAGSLIAVPQGWTPGRAPVAVVMIAYNEAHSIAAALDSIEGWAREVFLVDSYSTDDTVDIALSRGVTVVQRAVQGIWRSVGLRSAPTAHHGSVDDETRS